MPKRRSNCELNKRPQINPCDWPSEQEIAEQKARQAEIRREKEMAGPPDTHCAYERDTHVYNTKMMPFGIGKLFNNG